MSVAIRTAKQTKLTINAPELLNLQEMGTENFIALEQGPNTVTVEAGVFRVLTARKDVRVTADTADTRIVAYTKDGNGSPDGPKLKATFGEAAANWFTADALDESAPE